MNTHTRLATFVPKDVSWTALWFKPGLQNMNCMLHVHIRLCTASSTWYAREVGAECCDTQNLDASPIQHKAADRTGWSTTAQMSDYARQMHPYRKQL